MYRSENGAKLEIMVHSSYRMGHLVIENISGILNYESNKMLKEALGIL